MKKRIFSLFCALALCLSLLPVMALAADPIYLALGDSITRGYAPGEGGVVDTVGDPFANQVEIAQGYDLTNLAEDGENSDGLRTKLQDGSIDVTNADLITITIGGNDLMDALYAFLAEKWTADPSHANDPKDADAIKEMLTSGTANILTLGALVNYLPDFAQSPQAEGALNTFKTNLSQIVSAIKNSNPDVTLLVATQYNPYSYLAKEYGTSFTQAQTISDAFDDGVQVLNTAITQAAQTEGFTVVDVYTAFETAVAQDKNPCNPSVDIQKFSISLDFHPNQDGHDLIASTISDTLNKMSKKYDLWVSGIRVTSDNAGNVLGDNTVSYAADTNTLTLSGASIRYDSGPAISSQMEKLTIQLLGKNEITMSGDYPCIQAQTASNNGGSLTLTGQGILTATATSAVGMEAYEDLTIEGSAQVTVNANGNGIHSQAGNIYVRGNAVVKANSTLRTGLFANRNITIKDNAKVTSISESDSAVDLECVLTVTGPAQLYAESDLGEGIEARQKVLIQDGANVVAIGGISAENSQKEAVDIIDIDDSIVYVSSPEGKNDFVNVNVDNIGTFSVDGSWIHMSRKDENVNIADSVVFYGSAGSVIGSAAVPGNVELTAGETLAIPAGATLTVPDDVVLTSNGTLTVQGTMEIMGGGAFTGAAEVLGKVYVFEEENSANPANGATLALSNDGEVYAQRTALQGTAIQNGSMTTGTYPYTPADGSGQETFLNRWGYYRAASRGSNSGSASVTNHAVTVSEIESGSIKAGTLQTSQGTTVTLTVTPDKGYVLDSLTVTDKEGNKLPLTDKGDGVYTFEMPDSAVTVSAVFQAESSPLLFTDVDESDWFYKAVEYVYQSGLMNGTSVNTFDPNGTTSRAMIATILWRLEGSPVVDYQMTFDDVANGRWYTEAIRWAASEGIVGGYGDGSFGADNSITREQMAAMLYRYAQHKGYDVSIGENTNILSYTDAADLSEWAGSAMQWACGAGVITGAGNALYPQSDATRAEAATMLMRFCENDIV